MIAKENVKQSKPTLVSLIPNLVGGQGHIIPYHQSLSKAAKQLGWKHIIIAPAEPEIRDLPANWHFCLSSNCLEAEGNFFQQIAKIKDALILGFTIANYLRQEVIPNFQYSIIFMERFIHLQLFALTIALLLVPKNKLFIWLLYRRDIHLAKTRFIYKFLNNIIKKRLTSNRFKLLTDSELLSQSLSKYFEETVTVISIPHTDIEKNTRYSKQNYEILCWWPGSPRLEKGWEYLKAIVNFRFAQADKFCLVAAQSSELVSVSGGVQVHLIKNNLTRDEYNQWLCTCDFILLPYNSESYKERTSGIFTECIIAGQIPIVTPNTWMAKELSQYHLEELVIEWQNPELVWEKILEISQNLSIKTKISQMQEDYKKFHNIDKYAAKMKDLFYNLSFL